jgi:hypothetical protein
MMLALLAGAILYTWRRRKDCDFLRGAAPWLTLAAYALMSAIGASLGRATGLEGAMTLRYVTFSIHLPIALIFLGAWIGRDLIGRAPNLKPIVRRSQLVMAVIALCATAEMVRPCFDLMLAFKELHLQAKGGLELIELGELDSVRKKVDPFVVGKLTARTLALDDLGLFHPRVHRTRNVADFSAKSDAVTGILEHASLDGDSYTLTGWAILPHRTSPADDVIVAADMPDGSSLAIAFTDMFFARDNVAAIMGSAYQRSGWTITLPADRLPPGATWSAWAYDALTGKAYRIGSPP